MDRVVKLENDELAARARRIALVIADCDGVLTDNGVYYGEHGEVLKRFSIRDGMGVERLRAANIDVAIVSGERSPSLVRRAEKLRIERLVLGCRDKLSAVRAFGLGDEQLAFIGDDVNDLEALEAIARVGLTGTPLDGLVADAVHYRCRVPGGHGAFREFADWILQSRTA